MASAGPCANLHSPQTDNHTNVPPLSYYRPNALPGTQPTAPKHDHQCNIPRHSCGCGNPVCSASDATSGDCRSPSLRSRYAGDRRWPPDHAGDHTRLCAGLLSRKIHTHSSVMAALRLKGPVSRLRIPSSNCFCIVQCSSNEPQHPNIFRDQPNCTVKNITLI